MHDQSAEREERGGLLQAAARLVAGRAADFTSSPADDIVSDVRSVVERLRDTRESAIFGAFRPHLVGAVGLYREPQRKASHKAHLWSMYVAPEHRRQGLARELLQAALDHARKLRGVIWVQLSVSAAAPAARKLYERAGFEIWGTEPGALRHDGRWAVVHHMALRLE